MTQDQHIQDFMDQVDEKILTSERRRSGRVMVEVVSRYGYTPVTMDIGAFGQKIFMLEGPLPHPAPVQLAYTHYIEAVIRLVAYRRWLASNGPVKRTTSEFVRSQKERIFNGAEDLRKRILDPDHFTAAKAWSELLNG